MISFFGEHSLKDAVIARIMEHQRLDQLIQGTYWDGARGCAIGCVLHSDDHMAYESQLGLPVFLAYMDEHIFERLPLAEAKHWPVRFIEAVPVGVNLELVFPRFMHWILSDPGGMRQHANRRTVPIIDSLVTMYARRIDGIAFDAEAAWAVAEAAGASGAAAEAAARAAARSAARAAARAAAWAAARASGAAAEAAEAAARASGASGAAAEAAARASGASGAAAGAAAGAAQIRRQADYLIALLHSYESRQILVAAPCEERVLMP